MKVERGSWRKRKSSAAVSTMPMMMLLHASSTDAWMNWPESLNHTSSMPVGSSPLRLICSTRLRMPLMTSMALASPFLTMKKLAAGRPFTKALLRTSRLISLTSATSRR